ncbi:MAG: hypothetical protein H7832_08355, partial [Magnetococcus sp. DMHC-6]
MGRPPRLFSSTLTFFWTLSLLLLSIVTGYYVAHILELTLIRDLFTLPSFLSIPLEYQTKAPILRTLFGVIAGFLFFFLTAYLFQAILDAMRLLWVGRSLDKAIRMGRLENGDDSPSKWVWSYYPLFTRLWRDFTETLHRQRHPAALLGEKRVQYRSTTPSEVFFSHQVLVDMPMRVEFFRHLPGILTGTGIVSTFAGILLGLTEFNPMVAPDQITMQLKNLFVGVSTAFVASFLAISTAIILTVLEKLILNWRYTQVTLLQGRLDDMFMAGVEPEYLAELVRSESENTLRMETLSLQLLPRLIAYLDRSEKNVTPTSEPNPEAYIETLTHKLSEHQLLLIQQLDDSLKKNLSKPLQLVSQSLRLFVEEQRQHSNDAKELEHQFTSLNTGLNQMTSQLKLGFAQIDRHLQGTNHQNDQLNQVIQHLETLSDSQHKLNQTLTQLVQRVEEFSTQTQTQQASTRQENRDFTQKISEHLDRTLNQNITISKGVEELRPIVQSVEGQLQELQEQSSRSHTELRKLVETQDQNLLDELAARIEQTSQQEATLQTTLDALQQNFIDQTLKQNVAISKTVEE